MGNMSASERYAYPSAGTWDITQGPDEVIPPPVRPPTSPADLQAWLLPSVEEHALDAEAHAALNAWDTETMEQLIGQLTLQTVGTITEEKDLHSILALVDEQTEVAREAVRALYADRIIEEHVEAVVQYFLHAARCKLHVMMNPMRASTILRFGWAQTSGVINLTHRTLHYGDASNIPRMAKPFYASMNDVIRAVNEGQTQLDFQAYMIDCFSRWTAETARQDMMQFNHWQMSRERGFIK